MKDWKKNATNWGAVMSIVTAFFYAPIPLTTGNVTTARWIYNIPGDIRSEMGAIEMASIKRDVQNLEETRAEGTLNAYRFQMILYEMQLDRLKKSSEPDKTEMERLQRRIDKMYDRIDDSGIQRDDIRSQTSKLYIANQ